MARIAEEEIERLKKEVDLALLVGKAGVELKRAGADLVGRCPFHSDDTPSLVVSPHKGLWHCMGACQAGGSVIDWVMRAERVSFRHAVELLRDGTASGAVSAARSRSTVRQLRPPVAREASDEELLCQVVDYYHARLTESPEALAYLARRRIDDPQAITTFRLGFSDRTLGLRIAHKRSVGGAELRAALQRIGVYRPSGHEHLVGCLTIPVLDSAGRVSELYGRRVTSALSAGTARHLYLPGPHRGVWNEAALQASSEVVLTESLIDALTLWCCGIRNVTCSYGTCGFGDDHRDALVRHRVARLLIAYDHDRAGDQAAETLAGELTGLGIECFRVVWPAGADANDVAVAAERPADELARYLRAARFLGAGRPSPVPTAGTAAASSSTARSADSSAAAAAPPSSSAASSAASPVPALPAAPAVVCRHDELVLDAGPRRYRVRGIGTAPSPGALRVNVMVSAGERFHVDVLDLYAARQRQAYVAAAGKELYCDEDALKAELGRVMLATEEARDAAAAQAATPAVPELSAAEREEALALLCDPRLAERVGEAFSAVGLVGESDAALVLWLVLVSRLAERPLGAVVQSSSAAGKSTLAEAALSLLPDEGKVAFSAMTGQALYYLQDADLAHKVLAIAEEEGASRAGYALKLLVSEGKLSIAAAGKDPDTGRLVTTTYEVSGPVALVMTTTAAELEEELANRLLVLAVDEGRRQTAAVQAAQRQGETLAGLAARQQREATLALHRNAQRLLSPLAVVNPHAPGLSFSDRKTRHRRDNAKYLGLIRAVALAHQHQRPRKLLQVGGASIAYIEASAADVALAERLAAAVLGVTTDELAPTTRRILGAITAHLGEQRARPFTRRELREATGLSDSQLKVHLARLCDLEHLSCLRSGPATTYRLLTTPYDADRPVDTSDRPVPAGHRPAGNADRPVSAAAPDSSAAREDGTDDAVSAGIGRSADRDGKHVAASTDGAATGDRPVSRRLRVLREGTSDVDVVVEGASR
jgi:DNA primase